MLGIGAVSGIAYFLAFLGGEVYSSSQLRLTGKLPTTADGIQIAQFVLLHSHAGQLIILTAIEVISSLILVGVALGMYAYLRDRSAGLARFSLVYASISSVILAIGAILLSNVALSAADQYVSASGADKTRILHDYMNPSGALQLVEGIGPTLFGGIVWLGLIGVALIRIQGSRSVAGWATIAAAILTPIFPTMAIWSAGAGYALFKAYRADGPMFMRPAPASASNHPVAPASRAAAPRTSAQTKAVVALDAAAATPPASTMEAPTSRPPRGTSERRPHPAAASGSKSARRHKRR
jgi:hypothetical protein